MLQQFSITLEKEKEKEEYMIKLEYELSFNLLESCLHQEITLDDILSFPIDWKILANETRLMRLREKEGLDQIGSNDLLRIRKENKKRRKTTIDSNVLSYSPSSSSTETRSSISPLFESPSPSLTPFSQSTPIEITKCIDDSITLDRIALYYLNLDGGGGVGVGEKIQQKNDWQYFFTPHLKEQNEIQQDEKLGKNSNNLTKLVEKRPKYTLKDLAAQYVCYSSSIKKI